jgi:hypothetical protein
LTPNFFQPSCEIESKLLESLQKSLEKAEDDVRLDRDQTHEKQQLLDVNDELRDEAAAQIAEARRAQANMAGDRDLSIESRAAGIWSTAVILLGSGAERLEAQVKRELIGRIVNISELMVDGWTRVNNTIDFTKIKADLQERYRHRANSLATETLKKQNINIVNLANAMVDVLEFVFLLQPLATVMTFLCDEARDPVLVESIAKTVIEGKLRTLMRNLWLSDIDAEAGSRVLTKSVRELPKSEFIRNAIAGLLMARVYWKQWDKEGRLILLRIANESLKGVGRHYKQEVIETLMNMPSTDDEGA